jgi:hypothetical protein
MSSTAFACLQVSENLLCLQICEEGTAGKRRPSGYNSSQRGWNRSEQGEGGKGLPPLFFLLDRRTEENEVAESRRSFSAKVTRDVWGGRWQWWPTG